MGHKSGTQTGRGRGRTLRGGGVQLNNGLAGVMVEDLLPVEEYDRYITSYHSLRFTPSQFFCDINEIERLGFGFKDLLVHQNLGRFLGLRNSYESSQVKAFYYVAERSDDGVGFVCQFKGHVVHSNPEIWARLTGLECTGVDIESENVFAGYDKNSFVVSISKACIAPLEYSNFNVMQLRCDDRILHWIIEKMIL